MTEDIAEVAGRLSADERWIPGYEGRYSIDLHGTVRSVERKFHRVNRGRHQAVKVPARQLVACLNRNGYPFVILYSENKGRTFEVHRLVCRVFHGEPAAGMEAAHIDGNRLNVSATNLRWATRRENHADKRLHGTHLVGSAVPKAKLTAEQAVQIVTRSAEGEKPGELARVYGVSESAIRRIRDGELRADDTASVRQHLETTR